MKRKKKNILFVLLFLLVCAVAVYFCACNVKGENYDNNQTGNNQDGDIEIQTPTPEQTTHTHSLTLVTAKSADCVNSGNSAYYTCACGKWFTDNNAQNEIIDKTSVTLKATGHKYSTEWSNDETYHWHSPKCSDTEKVKDKAKHTYVNYVCSVCGYNRIPDTTHLPQTDFKDVGEKFKSVVAPLYDVAETILQDLVSSGDVELRKDHNPRIIGIRYTEFSFEIIVREDIFINSSGEISEFLQQERCVELKHFGEANDEAYFAYESFLRAERKSQSLANYEEFILPYADRSAELISAQYEAYKNNKEICIHNMGKQLILSAESSLSEAYNKIIVNLNSALAKLHYPLITNQDLTIGFGGNLNWEIVTRWINIEVSIGTLRYSFYISFNENGEFSEDFINYYNGTAWTGYTPSDPDQLNPKNEEYSELFERLKIEELDLSNIKDSYTYDGNGSALYNLVDEYSFLYL